MNIKEKTARVIQILFNPAKNNPFGALLAILLSYIVVNLKSPSLYRFSLIGDSKIFFFLFTLFLWVLIASILSHLSTFLSNLLKPGLMKSLLIVVTIFILMAAASLSLVFFSFNLLNGDSLFFLYGSCGKEFNQRYLEALGTKDPSFCFDKNLRVNFYRGFKWGRFCSTPEGDIVSVGFDTAFPDPYSCTLSLAKATNDYTLCYKSGNSQRCIKDYAIEKKEAKLCDLVEDKEELFQCYKIIAWETKNKNLCYKIPPEHHLRSICLEE